MVNAAHNLAAIWSQAERDAWRPPARFAPPEWAERHYRIPARGNAEPGPYSLSRTPFWREVLEKLGDRETEWVIVMKPPQSGGSTVSRVAMGYWVDNEPGDVLLVYPSEDSASEQITERVAPMFEESPQLARWLTGRVYDVNSHAITLTHSTIYVGWSGSPQTLASRPCARVVLDECDKYRQHAKEADAEELAEARTKTYAWRRKILAISTPTVRTGTIYRLFNQSRDKRHYHCPCPGCGVLFKWEWSRVRWEERVETDDPDVLLDQADRVRAGDLRSWIECPECGHETEERDRLRAVALGEWVSEGFAPGEHPKSPRVAYAVSGLISPWISIPEIVEAFLRAKVKGDLHSFMNNYLGLPLEDEVTSRVSASVFEQRAQHRQFLVPDWATEIVAGADTQARNGEPYWYYTVRAYGQNYRSRLLTWGLAHSPEDLKRKTIDAAFPLESNPMLKRGATILLVDSGGAVEVADGNTTAVVYELAQSDPMRIIPTKGAPGRIEPKVRVRNNTYSGVPGSGKRPISVLLHMFDTEHFKDRVANLIQREDPVAWEECQAVTPEYVGHMTAEQKTQIRSGKRVEMRWIRTGRSRCDLWDCSVLTLVGAYILEQDRRARKQEAKPFGESPSAEAPAQPKPPNPPSQYREGRRLSIDRSRPWIKRRN